MLIFKIVLLTSLAVWLLAMLAAYQYGRIGRQLLRSDKRLTAVETELPPLSVIIAAHNQSPALRRHLPVILDQDYDRFEVIVIDMASTDETKDTLERLELKYANLRHTFTPASARDISVERLALTLGFRAASHEWVVITHADCEPLSPQWLMRIGETIVHPQQGLKSPHLKTPDMVLGIARYDERRSTWLDHKTGFFRLWNNIANIHHILDGHAAVRADACNLAFRKSYFIDCGGFATGQNLKAGAEELLVNHTSKPANTALVLAPSAIVVQDRISSEQQWRQERIFYAETRRYQRHARCYRFTQDCRLLMPWLVLLAIVVPLMVAITLVLMGSTYFPPLQLYILIGILTLLLIIYLPTKLVSFYKTTHTWGLRNYFLTLLLFELQLPLWHTSAWFSRRFAARNEFRKKFV